MGKFIQYRTRASLYDGPFDSVVGWSAAGIGDLIVTDGGRLIVIDGGRPEDAEDFLDLLEENAEGKPVVDLWIITHPHSDHYGAVRRICSEPDLLARLTIRQFMYYFPDEFVTRSGTCPNPGHNRLLGECSALAGAETVRPEPGMTVNIDGTEIEILYSPYDCRILNRAGNENFCSLILTVRGSSKKVMITGDANGRNMQAALWIDRKKLKSDILQMPHHGLCDAYNADFYREVNAGIVLIPTSIAGYRSMHNGLYSGAGIDANQWCEKNAAEVHLAFDGTVSLEI